MTTGVSVVVSCYNYGRYIATCLESLQKQTYQDFEVVIVDDGSTDDSFTRILPFLQDSRFRYIQQKNMGQASAKNRGIQEAGFRFIAFLDADDLWLPQKLEQQMPLFTKPDVGVVYSGFSRIDEMGQLTPDKPAEKKSTYLHPRRGVVTEHLLYDNFVPFSSSVVRRECFEMFGTFDETLSMGIDWDLWLRISTRYQFDFCEQPYLLYRDGHSGQMSKKILERLQCADRIVDAFTRKFSSGIPKSTLKEAQYYSCCNRGYALRRYGLSYSLKYYLKALTLFPLRRNPYLGLLKAPLRAMWKR